MMPLLYDNFGTGDSAIEGRVAPSGQTWGTLNQDVYSIQAGRLRAIQGTAAAPGQYAEVNIGKPVREMRAKISFDGEASGNSTVVLICSPDGVYGGSPGDYAGYKNMIHCLFGRTAFAVNVYENLVPSASIASFTYAQPCAVDGTVYEVWMRIDPSGRATFRCPDGSIRRSTDPRFAALLGPHLIFQTGRNSNPNLYPRIEEVAASAHRAQQGKT